MSGRRRGGSGRGVVTAFLALGCCLLAAPAAHADFDDLLDTVLGAATAGADVDLGGLPADSVDLGDLGAFQDPLAQLDQLFHDTPGPTDGTPEAPTDGTPDAPAEAGPGAPTDTTSDTPTGAEHHGESGNSNNLPSLPKFSIPSTGSGSGGSGGGGGGPGGSGGSNGSNGSNGSVTKTKANTSATNGIPTPVPEPASVP